MRCAEKHIRERTRGMRLMIAFLAGDNYLACAALRTYI